MIDDDQTIFMESHLEGYSDWYKESPESKIWQIDYIPMMIGPILFSFDQKTIYNFWPDYPDKLSLEEKQLFDEEFPELAELKGKRGSE
ncbi:hypothetical protein QP860_03445 [Aerococcus sp. UMB1112A]|uniref:DUF7675 family protein n=1 Tax=Aerococcus sp. UMB1112A TaxID=3050609 RepID=UPI00254F9344|nr:hypothetical protein [Aerococcus sp. UMB1112A]MDK8502103.1 hypothetical protein [Aerococcus sp. UMB1112A]